MLNMAGETHSESEPRREKEWDFCREKSGTPFYWKETGFHGGDPMDLRGSHGAALLIAKFVELGNTGMDVSRTPADSARTAVVSFTKEVMELNDDRVTFSGTWDPRSSSQRVTTAVQGVLDTFMAAFRAYVTACRGASPQEQLSAVRNFAGSRDGLLDLVPGLAAAAKVQLMNNRDAAELALKLRRERSRFMGQAAVDRPQAGVWKVGSRHLADLKDSTLGVSHLSRINLVTREEFNQEFEAWRAEKGK